MQRQDFFQLSQILRPALAAAHVALLPGLRAPRPEEADDQIITSALQALNMADKQLVRALSDIQNLAAKHELDVVSARTCSQNLGQSIERFASLLDACHARRLDSTAPWQTLTIAARDALVMYTHFLAQLLLALARPDETAQALGLPAQADNGCKIELSCRTDLPDDLNALMHWHVGNFLYDQQQTERALRCAAQASEIVDSHRQRASPALLAETQKETDAEKSSGLST